MRCVTLQRNGQLQFINQEGDIIDASCDAACYLFDLAELDEDLIVRDIFLLLRNNPIILALFRHIHAADIIHEAFSEEPVLYSNTYNPENIEYVELWRNCEFDHKTKTCCDMHILCMTGVGFALREPWINDFENYALGDRRRFGLSFMTPTHLLNYPLRFKDKSELLLAGKSGSIENVSFGLPTLGQIVHSVLWELSFYGIGELTC